MAALRDDMFLILVRQDFAVDHAQEVSNGIPCGCPGVAAEEVSALPGSPCAGSTVACYLLQVSGQPKYGAGQQGPRFCSAFSSMPIFIVKGML